MDIDKVYEALLYGNCKKIEKYIKEGLNVNIITEGDNWNMLHFSLEGTGSEPDLKLIKYLIKIGVDVNAREVNLWTPLHFAARRKSTDAMKLLIDAGAEVDAVNDEGLTPLQLTISVKPFNLKATEFLLLSGADPYHKAGSGKKTIMDGVKIISHGKDVGLLELFQKIIKEKKIKPKKVGKPKKKKK